VFDSQHGREAGIVGQQGRRHGLLGARVLLLLRCLVRPAASLKGGLPEVPLHAEEIRVRNVWEVRAAEGQQTWLLQHDGLQLGDVQKARVHLQDTQAAEEGDQVQQLARRRLEAHDLQSVDADAERPPPLVGAQSVPVRAQGALIEDQRLQVDTLAHRQVKVVQVHVFGFEELQSGESVAVKAEKVHHRLVQWARLIAQAQHGECG